jgi:thiamine-monophosphate kinase
MQVKDLGEKQIIRQILQPLFNPGHDLNGIGDDCAVLACSEQTLLVTTDRVPHDLIAFRAGLISYRDLGAYTANLNLSDIAASGGKPTALLLTLALPAELEISDLHAFCQGFLAASQSAGARIVGGDISSSNYFSASATALGFAQGDGPLRRSSAGVGNRIFLTRPLGTTTAALVMATNPTVRAALTSSEQEMLTNQFRLKPLLSTAQEFAVSRKVTSCMDNTDGVGNCLYELAEASGLLFVVDKSLLKVPAIVEKVANLAGIEALELAFSAGADFSLVGTAVAGYSPVGKEASFVEIGYTEQGEGVALRSANSTIPLRYTPWDYFVSQL